MKRLATCGRKGTSPVTEAAVRVGAPQGGRRDPLLSAHELTVHAGRRSLVRPTTVTLFPGEWKALIGPNGAGKSSLLKAVATLIPSRGELRYRGEPVAQDAAAYRRELGVVLHESLLYREMTAYENLEFFARLYDIGRPAQAATRYLRDVGLARFAHELVGRFSRGMLQRLAVARALLHAPNLLLLDEPLAGIDAEGAAGILDLFKTARAAGISALWVTHRWERAWGLVDEVLEMHRGDIAGTTRTDGVDLAEWQPMHAAAWVSS